MPPLERPAVEFAAPVALSTTQFRLFRELIYDKTGISLGENKQEFVQSRLNKRLRHHNLRSFTAYFNLLNKSDPEGAEMQQMINRITTNKTHFFREEHHFDYLKEVVFPKIIDQADRKQRPKKLRIWCAAASTGEEPYSLAITVKDAFARRRDWDIRILASDIDTNVLQQAEAATYREDQIAELPSEMKQSHFVKNPSKGTMTVRPETADLVTFRQLNLLDSNWPIRAQFDAVFCRNVLIYFDSPTQDRIMRTIGRFLAPDGSLFIGHSESLSRLSETFVRVGKTVYQHVNQSTVAERDRHSTGQHRSPNPNAQLPDRRVSSLGNSVEVAPPTLARKRIVVGEVHASDTPTEVSTVLGSCIAVCLYDQQARLGGMNHFALPSGEGTARKATSFGVHAMELLINQIMGLGGDRRRLQAKVFGGAKVIELTGDGSVGERNAEFIRQFLQTESIPITAEYLGGDRGMQVLFETHIGRARMKLLDHDTAVDADRQLNAIEHAAPPEPVADVTLF